MGPFDLARHATRDMRMDRTPHRGFRVFGSSGTMEQHFLWKSHTPEETYAASAHGVLLRDRYDKPILLDPNTMKNELSAEGRGKMSEISRLGILQSITRGLDVGLENRPDINSVVPNNVVLGLGAGTTLPMSPETGNIAAGTMAGNTTPGNAPMTENESGRKVVSTKRAAQNRNSQNAFRKRRQKYVQELESTAEKAKDMQKTIDVLHKTIEELRLENMELREFSLALQTRLMELERDAT